MYNNQLALSLLKSVINIVERVLKDVKGCKNPFLQFQGDVIRRQNPFLSFQLFCSSKTPFQ